jgi:hypothetical protein
MIAAIIAEIDKCKKTKITISELEWGQFYQIQFNKRKRYCRFSNRIGNILYFVKPFKINNEFVEFSLNMDDIFDIVKVDYKYDYMYEGRRIIKDYKKISLSL